MTSTLAGNVLIPLLPAQAQSPLPMGADQIMPELLQQQERVRVLCAQEKARPELRLEAPAKIRISALDRERADLLQDPNLFSEGRRLQVFRLDDRSSRFARRPAMTCAFIAIEKGVTNQEGLWQ